MDELMTNLIGLGLIGSFLMACAMAWYVTPPAWTEPRHGSGGRATEVT